VLIFGASAIADRRDAIPAAIEQSGGKVSHFGMPVDPGNLMLIGNVGDTPVLGAPGCAGARRKTASTGCFRGFSPDCRSSAKKLPAWA